MANTQYTSITRLLLHCDVKIEEEININRIKKQLAAEFDFAADGFIVVDGFTFNKNDVFAEIERPDFLQRLAYHNKIWQNKYVLAMLETYSLDLHELRIQIKTFANDTQFDAFFSPYFAIPFSYNSRKLITDNNLEALASLLLFEDFLQHEDREEGFKPIRIFLDDSIRLLRNINADNYSSFKPQIQPWVKGNFSYFLNHLPNEFHGAKNDVVLHLINLTVRTQKINKKDCLIVSKELTAVTNIEKELHDLIYNNHLVYTGAGSNSSDGKTNYWWVVWVIFILLRIMSGC